MSWQGYRNKEFWKHNPAHFSLWSWLWSSFKNLRANNPKTLTHHELCLLMYSVSMILANTYTWVPFLQNTPTACIRFMTEIKGIFWIGTPNEENYQNSFAYNCVHTYSSGHIKCSIDYFLSSPIIFKFDTEYGRSDVAVLCTVCPNKMVVMDHQDFIKFKYKVSLGWIFHVNIFRLPTTGSVK